MGGGHNNGVVVIVAVASSVGGGVVALRAPPPSNYNMLQQMLVAVAICSHQHRSLLALPFTDRRRLPPAIAQPDSSLPCWLAAWRSG